MKMTMEQLTEIISTAFLIGRMEATKAYEPTADMIRTAELEAWCKATATDWRKVRVLMERGRIRARRMGTAKNSPLVYSKEEVKRQLAVAGIASEMELALEEESIRAAALRRNRPNGHAGRTGGD